MKNNKDILQEFDYSKVHINDDFYNSITQKDVDFLNTFDPERLLYNFRLTAGDLPNEINACGPYSGWENTRIGGHTLGHYLTAAAQGVKNGYGKCFGKDSISLENRLNTLIDGLEYCQNKNDKAVENGNMNRHKGFIFGATMADSSKPELQFEKVKSPSAADTWVPWYNLHKVINGLVETYKLTKNKKALKIVLNLGEWVYCHVSKWSSEEKERVLRIEYGGMNDCLYELYMICKEEGLSNAEHIKIAAQAFDEVSLFEKIIKYNNKEPGFEDVLNNHHANCTIPKFVGALNGYKATGDTTLLQAAQAFWELVVNHHTYITGGNSECEHFGKDDILDLERSNCNCETCNTHNMLKFTKELFMLTGEIKYADFYERTYLNAIMASVNAETGMTAYFQPMATGCFKNYCNSDVNKNYFWCCTGTGLENFTKLNEDLYFKNENTIFANMFLSSTVNWDEKNVVIKQVTNIPENTETTFTIQTAENVDFTLAVRIPYWEKDIPEVKINGEKVLLKPQNRYIKISKKWNGTETVTINFHFGLTAYTLPDNRHTYGFMYGPLVLAAKLGNDTQMNIRQVGVLCDVSANKLVFGKLMPLNGNYGGTSNLPVLPGEILTVEGNLQEYFDNLESHLVKTGNLTFTLKDTDCQKELEFSPYYKINSGRYGIYWIFRDNFTRDICANIYTEGTKTYIDGIGVGYGSQTEGNNTTWPCMEEEGTGSCADSGALTRYAYKDGSFSYLLKVVKNKENFIKVNVQGTKCLENSKDDSNPINTLVIYVLNDGKKEILKEVQLSMADEKQELEIKIPSFLIEKAEAFGNEGTVLRVYFEGKNKSESAKLCAPLETYYS